MNKTEQALVKAIESKDYDKAVKALSKFSELKSTTDKQSNDYFDKIESLLEDKEVEEVVENIEEEVIEEVEEVVAPRVEKRGVKAKTIERKELEKKYDDLMETAVNYFAQVKKERSSDAVFARRLIRRLTLVKKQVLR